MKIVFIANYADGIHKNRALNEEWQEDIFVEGTVTEEEAEKVVLKVIEGFNDTLRSGEQPRKFVRLVALLPLDRCFHCRTEVAVSELERHERLCLSNPDNQETEDW